MKTKGRKHIIRPDWFTKEEFEKLRSQGYKMMHLCNVLFVSEPVLRRFLNELGIPKQSPGRKARL